MNNVTQININDIAFPDEIDSSVFMNAFTLFLRVCHDTNVALRLEYKPRDVSRLLDCSIRTLARMRESGNGPRFIKRNNQVFYRLHELIQWSLENPSFSNTAQANCNAA